MALCSNQVSDDSLDWTQLNLLQQQEGNARFMISKRKGGARQPAAAAAHEDEQQQQGQAWEGPELKGIILRCPRCDSSNTKFCYYNNYNRSQPRHICKTCKRHWTQGGTLRNVPVGGSRKSKTHHPKTRTKAKTLPTSLADSVQAILQPLAPVITYEHDIDLDNMLLSHEINDSSNTRSSTNSSGSSSSSSYNASCFTASPSQTLPPTLLPPLPQLTYSSTMGFGFNEWEWESSFPSFQSDSLSDLATGTINWPDSSTNLLDSTTWNWEDLATLLSSAPTLTHSSFASSSLVTDTFKS